MRYHFPEAVHLVNGSSSGREAFDLDLCLLNSHSHCPKIRPSELAQNTFLTVSADVDVQAIEQIPCHTYSSNPSTLTYSS